MKTSRATKLVKNVTALMITSLMNGCVEEPVTEQPTIVDETMDTIIETSAIEEDMNCPNGGFILKAGNDSNENGILEEDEVSTVNYLCHGENGQVASNIATKVIEESSSFNCSMGGVNVYFGLDLDNDKELSDSEIQSSFFVCHGQNGEDGKGGINGLTSLSKITQEGAGDNCENGGLKFDIGLDNNADLNLGDEEIEFTYYVCHGSNGSNSLTKITNETSGDFCEYDGIIIETGLDSNSNGTLDSDEVMDTQYVCNGVDGSDGEDGEDGDDGEDGEPGSSDIYEYYFSNGLDNYTGTSDVSIIKLNNEGLNEEILVVENEVNPANGFLYATNSLIHFNGVETILSDLGESNFEVVEAILYLRVETPIIDGGQANALGVQVLVPNSPLFVENEANWVSPYDESEWFDSGASGVGSSAHDFSDMLMLPDPTKFQFKGTVPMLLTRGQIKEWVEDADSNNGVVLTLIDQSNEYNLSIASSENDEISYRPMLYVKVKKSASGVRIQSISDQRYKQNWLLKSNEEKMSAYNKIH